MVRNQDNTSFDSAVFNGVSVRGCWLSYRNHQRAIWWRVWCPTCPIFAPLQTCCCRRSTFSTMAVRVPLPPRLVPPPRSSPQLPGSYFLPCCVLLVSVGFFGCPKSFVFFQSYTVEDLPDLNNNASTISYLLFLDIVIWKKMNVITR